MRPLYQYINYDNPELNSPSEDESDTPGTAVLGDAVGAPDRANPEESKESHHAGNREGAVALGLGPATRLAIAGG